MSFIILTVGKTNNLHYRALLQDYLERIGHYLPLKTSSVSAEKPGALRPQEIMNREGKRILAAIAPHDWCLALDRKGVLLPSTHFAALLEKQINTGKSLVCVIGGPFGLGEEVLRRSNYVLSLSPMTLAHELAVVILMEQIYRALTILKGEKYHK
jgi:23S rRNA (pseudouridine1915-N3)-methyltransferase